MDFTSKHAAFVIAAYLLSFAVLGTLVAYLIWRDRALAAKLNETKK